MKVDEELLVAAADRVRAETGFEGGAEILTAAIMAALGFPEYPERHDKDTDRSYVKRCERHRLSYVSVFEALREHLLIGHKIDLKATGRGSYRIVPASQQAVVAARDGAKAARKALRQSMRRIENVNTDRLDTNAKLAREAALLNTAARLAMMSNRTPARVLKEARDKAVKYAAEKSSTPAMKRVGE